MMGFPGRSILWKTMPEWDGAGQKRKLTAFPVWTPTPEKETSFFKVLCCLVFIIQIQRNVPEKSLFGKKTDRAKFSSCPCPNIHPCPCPCPNQLFSLTLFS